MNETPFAVIDRKATEAGVTVDQTSFMLGLVAGIGSMSSFLHNEDVFPYLVQLVLDAPQGEERVCTVSVSPWLYESLAAARVVVRDQEGEDDA